MKWLSAALTVVLSGCGAATGTLSQAQAACQRGASHVEVTFNGTVGRILGVRRGPSGTHEGFLIRPDGAATSELHVEDNIDITGFIPLHRSERIELQGQYECNDGVIHWTHRDTRGRHPAGYIKANGITYQ
ncbi:MAG: hypothetical protein DLM50_00200 [Candidatus Meridianibacter frigidus]|nr:MAG: hypothetical protein DLM50_00200 [Candidatus Eremiobacteraeota bacterium]